MIEPILKAQLSRDEGRRLEAYLDSEGYWTIGVGHLLDRKKGIVRPRIERITDAECDAFLAMDVEIATKSLVNVFGVERLAMVDPPRYRAMVNMMFNRGETRVRTSTTITPAIMAAMDAPDAASAGVRWQNVANAILASPWGQQIKGRADRLARQFATGRDV